MASGHHPLCPMRGCLREPPERSGHPLAQRLISPLLARGTQLGGGDPGGGLTAPRMRLSSSPCMVSVMGRHTTVTPDRPTYRPSQATRRSSRNRSFNVACLPGMTVSVFLAAWCGAAPMLEASISIQASITFRLAGRPQFQPSPRARGNTRRQWLGVGIERFIPACAGNTHPPPGVPTSAAVHPRLRGEHT
jgi:hypothetical protein